MTTRVQLVYPCSERISCPSAIGRNVRDRLREAGYEVLVHDMTDRRTLTARQNDVLLGHIHPLPGTTFRRSMRDPRWQRVIAMGPFNHDLAQTAFLDRCLPHCDLYLAITGNYWFSRLQESRYSHWRPKMIHLDLAVDQRDFPPVKTSFGPPGRRRFLYIGGTGPPKNIQYLEAFASHLKGVEFSWIGAGKCKIHGVQEYGHLDFGDNSVRRLVAEHDFMLTVGRYDANPATILESMAWGLIPICTPQSGYEGFWSIPNVPLGDLDVAARTLKNLQSVSEDKLKRMQAENWRLIRSHFNWSRFSSQVVRAIESNDSPECYRTNYLNHVRIRWSELSSPYWGWKAIVRHYLKLLLLSPRFKEGPTIRTLRRIRAEKEPSQ